MAEIVSLFFIGVEVSPTIRKVKNCVLDHAGLILTQEVSFTSTAPSVTCFQRVCRAGIDFQDQRVFGTQIGIITGDIPCARGPGIKYLGNRRQRCVWVSNKPHKHILQFSVPLAVLVAPCT